MNLSPMGSSSKDLQNNQEFVSAVMHASQVALRTHHDAKLEALRNAILNVATGQGPNETLQHLFLEFVDSFTELHLRILKLFQAPPAPPGMNMGGLGSVLEHNIPDLRGQQELYRQLWKDLYSRGVVNTDSVSGTMSASGLASKRTTELGDAFLSFIEAPK